MPNIAYCLANLFNHGKQQQKEYLINLHSKWSLTPRINVFWCKEVSYKNPFCFYIVKLISMKKTVDTKRTVLLLTDSPYLNLKATLEQ
mmetsp:Transcript_9525/g.10239  ORF Transcript_9525/g.10239 Transcript_9525/m.10239 type:complete len:88 (+) Transcript_9525:125-388(+)